MPKAVIVSCARSPVVRSAFEYTRIDDVAAEVLGALLRRVPKIDPKQIDEVIIGCATQEAEQGLNIAQSISLLAGIPASVGALTVNRSHASSLEAVNLAVKAIIGGAGDLYLAGGVESTSHVPPGGFNPSLNCRLAANDVQDAVLNQKLWAEHIAKKFSISREEQDRFSVTSHMKAVSAAGRGKFSAEIVPVNIFLQNGSKSKVTQDENPASDATMETFSQLSPFCHRDGTVTEMNFAPFSDSAAMFLIASEKFVKKMNLRPIAKIISIAASGSDAGGMGALSAVQKALAKARIKLKNIGLVEINETSAAEVLAITREIKLDEKRLNVHGGALALGNPFGAGGARILATLVHAMISRECRTGMAALSGPGGQGMAVIVEKI